MPSPPHFWRRPRTCRHRYAPPKPQPFGSNSLLTTLFIPPQAVKAVENAIDAFEEAEVVLTALANATNDASRLVDSRLKAAAALERVGVSLLEVNATATAAAAAALSSDLEPADSDLLHPPLPELHPIPAPQHGPPAANALQPPVDVLADLATQEEAADEAFQEEDEYESGSGGAGGVSGGNETDRDFKGAFAVFAQLGAAKKRKAGGALLPPSRHFKPKTTTVTSTSTTAAKDHTTTVTTVTTTTTHDPDEEEDEEDSPPPPSPSPLPPPPLASPPPPPEPEEEVVVAEEVASGDVAASGVLEEAAVAEASPSPSPSPAAVEEAEVELVAPDPLPILAPPGAVTPSEKDPPKDIFTDLDSPPPTPLTPSPSPSPSPSPPP